MMSKLAPVQFIHKTLQAIAPTQAPYGIHIWGVQQGLQSRKAGTVWGREPPVLAPYGVVRPNPIACGG